MLTGIINHKSKKIKLINIYVPNGNPVATENMNIKKSGCLISIKT